MIKLKSLLKLIVEDTNPSEKTINDEFKINEDGLWELKKKLEKLNKNLIKYNLQPLKLVVLKTEKVLARHQNTGINEYIDEHTVKMVGTVPEINDYEFIGKVEHTEKGNIINLNGKIKISELPSEYKTYNQRCDICKTNRERNNTFILRKVENGEFVVCGSGCLKRMFPADIAKKFVQYATYLEAIRRLLIDYSMYSSGGEDGEYEHGSKYKNPNTTYDIDEVLLYGLIAYLQRGGKYISKKAQEETGQMSTADLAKIFMFSNDPDDRLKASKLKPEAEKMLVKLKEWIDNYDFDQAALDTPDLENYFYNMKVVFRLDYVKMNSFGYVISILSFYFKDLQKNNTSNANSSNSDYVGKEGDKINITAKITDVKQIQTSYGPSVLIKFETESGHNLIWFAQPSKVDTKQLRNAMINKEIIKVSGTIKKNQINSYTGLKETTLNYVKMII